MCLTIGREHYLPFHRKWFNKKFQRIAPHTSNFAKPVYKHLRLCNGMVMTPFQKTILKINSEQCEIIAKDEEGNDLSKLSYYVHVTETCRCKYGIHSYEVFNEDNENLTIFDSLDKFIEYMSNRSNYEVEFVVKALIPAGIEYFRSAPSSFGIQLVSTKLSLDFSKIFAKIKY